MLTYFIKKTEFELADEEVKFIGELNIELFKNEVLNKQLENDIELQSQLIAELKQLSEKMNKESAQNKKLSDKIKILENKSSALSKSIGDLQIELKLLHTKNETTRKLLENKKNLKQYIAWIY